MVFDEDGAAVEPLALLAASELGRGVEDREEEGMYVVHEQASERFREAADLLKK